MPIQIGDMTLYTVADLAEMLEVSESTITKYIREGMFKARKMGRKWYVPDKSIQEYFETLEDEEDEAEAEGEAEAAQEEPVTAPEQARVEPADVPTTTPQPRQEAGETQKTGVEDAEVAQMLEEIERLKGEAGRLEQLYGGENE